MKIGMNPPSATGLATGTVGLAAVGLVGLVVAGRLGGVGRGLEGNPASTAVGPGRMGPAGDPDALHRPSEPQVVPEGQAEQVAPCW